jgi:hypothetical protein
MRSILKTGLTALAAVLALTAIAASSALAAPEWYVKKGGTWSKVSTPVSVQINSIWSMVDTKTSPGEWGIACPSSGEGKVKAGGAAEVASFAVEGGVHNCVPAGSPFSQCKPEGVESVGTANFPWATELYKEGSEFRQRSVFAAEHQPILTGSCLASFGRDTDSCDLTASMNMTVNGEMVEASFDAKSGKTQCLQGKAGSGEFQGYVTYRVTLAEKAKGVEAIKVE